MAFSKLRLHEISEFERERFRLKIEEELETLSEIQGILEDSLFQSDSAREGFYEQRAKAFSLKTHLERQREVIRLKEPLKMLSMDLKQMKKAGEKLKKRLIIPLQDEKLQEKILFLKHKLEEEIAKEEMEQNEGFKSFFITLDELQILSELKAI